MRTGMLVHIDLPKERSRDPNAFRIRWELLESNEGREMFVDYHEKRTVRVHFEWNLMSCSTRRNITPLIDLSSIAKCFLPY